MSNTQELRFQGLCLVNSEGYLYMREYYDSLPELVRDRLKSSSYNLCAACVCNEVSRKAHYHDHPPTVTDYLNVILYMEQQLQRQERNRNDLELSHRALP